MTVFNYMTAYQLFFSQRTVAFHSVEDGCALEYVVKKALVCQSFATLVTVTGGYRGNQAVHCGRKGNTAFLQKPDFYSFFLHRGLVQRQLS